MTTPGSPPSPSEDQVPRGRLALWAVLAVMLLVGIYLYFRYEPDINPLLGLPG